MSSPDLFAGPDHQTPEAQPSKPERTTKLAPVHFWSETLSYLAPAWRADPNAVSWETYLVLRCRWSPLDFQDAGERWGWDAAIPARADWDREVESLNIRLRRIEREQESRNRD